MGIFLHKIITTAGKDLIAQATAANPIVWTRAAVGNSPLTAEEAEEFDDYNTGTGRVEGSIFSASASAGVTRLTSLFGNVERANPFKVVGVAFYGRLANATQDVCAVVLCNEGDAEGDIYLPTTASPKQSTRFAVNIEVQGGETMAVVETGAASLADLDRYMTVHKAGNPSEGDIDQTVYGVKKFEDDITLKYVTLSGNVDVTNDALIEGYTADCRIIMPKIECSARPELIPYTNATLDVVSDAQYPARLRFRGFADKTGDYGNFRVMHTTGGAYYNDYLSLYFRGGSTSYDSPFMVNGQQSEIRFTANGSILTTGNLFFFNPTDGNVSESNIGQASSRVKEAHIQTAHVYGALDVDEQALAELCIPLSKYLSVSSDRIGECVKAYVVLNYGNGSAPLEISDFLASYMKSRGGRLYDGQVYQDTNGHNVKISIYSDAALSSRLSGYAVSLLYLEETGAIGRPDAYGQYPETEAAPTVAVAQIMARKV